VARVISDTNVVPITSGKGKSKGKKAAPPQVEQETRPTLEALLEARKHCKTPDEAAQLDVDIAQRRAEADERAPSFGHNEPDVGVFLQEVGKVRRQIDVIDAAKLVVKTEMGVLKDIRTGAREKGIVLREMDEAIAALDTENVDLIAREKRRRLYMTWLGIDLGEQGQFDLKPADGLSDAERDATRWFKRGDTDGRLGKPRNAPEGCPPENLQDYLKGHEAGQTLLMQSAPLTAGAFKPAAETPKASEDGKILILKEEHFAPGTKLEDCNLKTLLPEHADAVHRADRVIALYGAHKRIIKEPEEDGTTYLDTGDDDVPVSEPEAVAPEAADLA
jgi:hypothetical protein